jgi:hypothetical protein
VTISRNSSEIPELSELVYPIEPISVNVYYHFLTAVCVTILHLGWLLSSSTLVPWVRISSPHKRIIGDSKYIIEWCPKTKFWYMCKYWLLVGIRSVPCSCVHFPICWVPHMSSNHSWFNHQSSLLWLQQRHLVAKRGENWRINCSWIFLVSISIIRQGTLNMP